MSSAKADCSSGLGHGVAAVLDDDDLAVEPLEPRQGVDQDRRPGPRACSRVLMRSRPSSLRRRRARGRWSRSWRRCRRHAGRPRCATSRPVRSTRSRGVAGRPAATHLDAVDGDVEVVGVEGGRGRADGGQHPAPVGVVAEQRALEQVVPRDRPADLDRVVLGGGAADVDGDLLGGAFGVGEQLPARGRRRPGRGRLAQVGGIGRRRRTRRTPAGPPCRWWTCSRRSRGGRRSGRVASRSAVSSVARVGHRVGGEHAQHGGQAGRQHAGALGHAADRPAVRVPNDVLSWTGVGGADGLGGVVAALARQRGDRAVDAGQQLVHRQPLADEAGGADGDVAGADGEGGRHVLGGAMRVGKPVRAGAGVGAAGVEDDGTQRARRRGPAATTAPARP